MAARFRDEEAPSGASAFQQRVRELLLKNKTVESYRRRIDGQNVIFFRVWTGKREDGSNKVHADPDVNY